VKRRRKEMARFNGKTVNPTLTENKAGGQAYQESPELEFVSLMLTSMVQDTFYEKSDDTIKRIEKLIQNMPNKLFAAKASIYARNEFGMRSVSHVAAASIAKEVKGEEWTQRYFSKVVRRVDDMSEILSAYKVLAGLSKLRPIPNAVKKGFAKAFNRFDEYVLAKYQGKGKDVSLVDIVNCIHPVPNERNRQALQKLIKDELKCTETYNAKMTEAGKATKNGTEKEKAAAKAVVWSEFLAKGKSIEYFALLRNLRNIFEQASVADQKTAIELLCDPDLIKKSLVLPFRYDTAYSELKSLNSRPLMIGLTRACETALNNVPTLPGKTLIVIDSSGSMSGKPIQNASLLGSIIYKSNNDSDMMFFSDDANYVQVNPLTDIFTMREQIVNKCQMGGTNFPAIFQRAKEAYERIIILSDMQGWVGYHTPKNEFNKYKAKYNCPNCKIYSFDLAGQGTLQFPENNVYALAGFSEKIFDMMKMLESDKNAMVNTINAIEI
jgi:uncharacterized protein with von Willebrand factor type A (vWA) domain